MGRSGWKKWRRKNCEGEIARRSSTESFFFKAVKDLWFDIYADIGVIYACCVNLATHSYVYINVHLYKYDDDDDEIQMKVCFHDELEHPP